jgi:hypothetical protein
LHLVVAIATAHDDAVHEHPVPLMLSANVKHAVLVASSWQCGDLDPGALRDGR